MNRRFSILASVALALGVTASAQSVLGISAIGITTQYVHTYSATEMDYYTAYYYYAAAEHILWQDSSIVQYSYQEGDSSEPEGGYGIAFQMWYSTQLNHAYTLATNHGIYAYYSFYDPYSEGYLYEDPYGYSLLASGAGENNGDISAPDEEESPTYSGYYLGFTEVSDTTYPPWIDHTVLYGNATRGSTGYVAIYGYDLTKWAGATYTTVSGGGVSTALSYSTYLDPSQVNISYSVDTNAATGNRSLTLTTPFGTSNAVTFTVADPTPQISSVNPSPWPGATTTSFTISGTGFGSNPTLSITGPDIIGFSKSSGTDGQIIGSVTVADCYPCSDATVIVTSTGYGGNGFMQAPPGGTTGQSPPTNVQVRPTPKLTCNPNSLARGSTIACSITNAASGDVTMWKFTAGLVTVNGPTSTLDWGGPMAQTGVISATANGVNVSAYVTVNPRSWQTSSAQAQEVTNGSLNTTLPVPPGPQIFNGQQQVLMGVSEAYLNNNLGENPSHITVGPNNGFWFFQNPFWNSSTQSYYKYIIHPDLENQSSTFSLRQCGNYNAATKPNGFIDAATLLTQTNRHEWNSQNQSHWAHYDSAMKNDNLNPDTDLDNEVGTPDLSAQQFYNNVTARIASRITQIYAQEAVEPYPPNFSESGTFLGNVNVASPNYANCN